MHERTQQLCTPSKPYTQSQHCTTVVNVPALVMACINSITSITAHLCLVLHTVLQHPRQSYCTESAAPAVRQTQGLLRAAQTQQATPLNSLILQVSVSHPAPLFPKYSSQSVTQYPPICRRAACNSRALAPAPADPRTLVCNTHPYAGGLPVPAEPLLPHRQTPEP